MSRAFVKEEGDQYGDELPERPVPPGPNYVTPRGKTLLRERVLDLEAERKRLVSGDVTTAKQRRPVERDLRYFEARLESAIVVDPAKQEPGVVRFGASVKTREPDGNTRAFTIVGHDEADAEAGTVSWSSPLAEAVLGAKPGDKATWLRPAGETTIEILEVEFPK
ncbi:MAG: GreA/GreB family elongation factor [Elusimicrobiota bacterium]